MIDRLLIYKSECVDPYYNIATEKHLLETVAPGSCILYLWQNQNTVVIGRNQNAWAECRTELLAQEGGKLARRLSGGGAVFHDLGNLNFTFLMCREDYDLDRQLLVIQEACSSLGLQAVRSGRNDLLVQEQKFSGNAFYHTKGKAYHHGTLLIHADMEKLSRYLSPSKAKLEAKGVSSVRSRVVNLSHLVPDLTCEKMAQCMETAFCQVYGKDADHIVLSKEDHNQITATAEHLQSWDWLYGPKLPFTLACNDRFPWGSIRLELQVEAGLIAGVTVYTDAMQWDLADCLSHALTGCRFSVKSMCDALQAHPGLQEVAPDLCTLLTKQEL